MLFDSLLFAVYVNWMIHRCTCNFDDISAPRNDIFPENLKLDSINIAGFSFADILQNIITEYIGR